MCNCIIEKKNFLFEKIAERNPDKNFTKNGYKDGFQNESFLIEHNEIVLPNIFNMEYTFTKKDGTQSKPRNLTTSIVPTFCCFCGEKIEYEKRKS